MVARILIAIIALAGCKRQSELWCEMHPGDLEHCGYLDGGIDARPVCMGDPDCAGSPGAPYCELSSHFCVECYLPEHCVSNPAKKFCDLDTFLCTSCVANTDCASNVCLPTGVCGDDSNVAYVDPVGGSDNANCTFATQCKTIEAALLTKKPYVKLQGMISEAVIVDGQTVTFVAEPGTTLTRPMDGIVVVVTGGSDLAIFDLTIIGKNEKGINVDMNSTLRLTSVTVTGCNRKDKRAIEAKDATILIDRSTIGANIGGGISAAVSTIYQITNTFIYRNGAMDSMVGGANLASTSTAFNRFELNTVIDNKVAVGVGGVSCASSIATPNNIIARNSATGLNLSTTQTGGNCNFAQSLQATDLELFAFVMPDGTGPWDYHVTAGSMAIDRGVATDITIDFDGNVRPIGGKIDVGADEYKP